VKNRAGSLPLAHSPPHNLTTSPLHCSLLATRYSRPVDQDSHCEVTPHWGGTGNHLCQGRSVNRKIGVVMSPAVCPYWTNWDDGWFTTSCECSSNSASIPTPLRGFIPRQDAVPFPPAATARHVERSAHVRSAYLDDAYTLEYVEKSCGILAAGFFARLTHSAGSSNSFRLTIFFPPWVPRAVSWNVLAVLTRPGDHHATSPVSRVNRRDETGRDETGRDETRRDETGRDDVA
jgi:hypothetical protein